MSLQTTCSSPVGIRDAALFVFAIPTSYRQVAAVGDMLTYWPANPPVRNLTFATPTTVVSGDVGRVVSGSISGDTGTLLGYAADLKTWYVAPDATDDTFDIGETATITGGSASSGVVTGRAADTFCRAVTVTQDFDTPQLAAEEQTLQETAITNIITDWYNNYGTFAGTTTESVHMP